MRIAVIAADGRTGRLFVAAALAAGHTVHAGCRKPYAFPPHPQLTVFIGDATDPAYLRKLFAATDAVASFIGHTRTSAPDVQTQAITTIVSVMKALRMRRIVSLTGTGVRFPGDHVTLADRFLNLGILLLDPARVRDGQRHVAVLQQSDLDWTVLRVLKLQNTRTQAHTLREHGPTALYVGREEAAQATLDLLETGKFIHMAPIISRS